MRMDLKHTLVVSLFSALLSACAANSIPTKPPMTATPSATFTPSITPNPTTAPAPSSTSTRMPVPPFESVMLTDDLLFGAESDQCKLPCWHNLMVGKSTSDDVNAVSKEVLGYADDFEIQGQSQIDENVPTTRIITSSWQFESASPAPDFLRLRFWIDDDSGVLTAIRLVWFADRFSEFSTPQRTLQKLGQPSRVLFSTQESESPYSGPMHLILIFDEGLVIGYKNALYSRSNGVVSLCLDKPSDERYLMDVLITEPFSKELSSLTEFQDYYIKSMLEGLELRSEGISGMTPEHLTELAQRSDQPCLQLNIP